MMQASDFSESGDAASSLFTVGGLVVPLELLLLLLLLFLRECLLEFLVEAILLFWDAIDLIWVLAYNAGESGTFQTSE